MSYRVQSIFERCQEAFDNMAPPEEFCKDCGREASVDCICTGEVIDLEEDNEIN